MRNAGRKLHRKGENYSLGMTFATYFEASNTAQALISKRESSHSILPSCIFNFTLAPSGSPFSAREFEPLAHALWTRKRRLVVPWSMNNSKKRRGILSVHTVCREAEVPVGTCYRQYSGSSRPCGFGDQQLAMLPSACALPAQNLSRLLTQLLISNSQIPRIFS